MLKAAKIAGLTLCILLSNPLGRVSMAADQRQSEANSMQRYMTYLNADGLFSVDVPLDWSYEGQGEAGDYLTLAWFLPGTDKKTPVRIMVMLNRTEMYDSLDEFVEWYRQGIAKLPETIGDVTVESSMVSDYPAKRVTYVTLGKDGKTFIKMAWTFFRVENRFLLSLTCFAPVDQFVRYQPIFDTAISTFRAAPKVFNDTFPPRTVK